MASKISHQPAQPDSLCSSASAVDRATELAFLLPQLTGPPARKNVWPPVDLRSAVFDTKVHGSLDILQDELNGRPVGFAGCFAVLWVRHLQRVSGTMDLPPMDPCPS